jgi:hypothetical protein
MSMFLQAAAGKGSGFALGNRVFDAIAALAWGLAAMRAKLPV